MPFIFFLKKAPNRGGPTNGIRKLVGISKSQKKSPLEYSPNDLAHESLANLEVSTKVLVPINEGNEIVDVKLHTPDPQHGDNVSTTFDLHMLEDTTMEDEGKKTLNER